MIGIYKITNNINGKSYIGQSIHCTQRIQDHLVGELYIDKEIQKIGKENFSFEIIAQVKEQELKYWEDYYILKYRTLAPYGYNKVLNNVNLDTKTFLFEPTLVELIKSNCITLYLYLISISQYFENTRIFYSKDFTINKIRNKLKLHDNTIKKYWEKLEDQKIIIYNSSEETLNSSTDWKNTFMLRKKYKYSYYTITQEYVQLLFENIPFTCIDNLLNQLNKEMDIKLYFLLSNLKEGLFTITILRNILGLSKKTENIANIKNSLTHLKELQLIDYSEFNLQDNLNTSQTVFELKKVSYF